MPAAHNHRALLAEIPYPMVKIVRLYCKLCQKVSQVVYLLSFRLTGGIKWFIFK